MQLLVGGAVGAILGGGMTWNILGRQYQRLNDPIRQSALWRRVLGGIGRVFRRNQEQAGAGNEDADRQALVGNGNGMA